MINVFRFLRRKIVQCIFLLAAAIIIKQAYPAIGAQVGGWISGMADSRIAQAVSSMLSSLSDGDSLKDAVEVFHENIQNPAQN